MNAAMDFEDAPIPGARMVTIDVLGDDGELFCRTDFLQLGDCMMAGIRAPVIDQDFLVSAPNGLAVWPSRPA